MYAGTIPEAQNGDAYLLREILHDWNDANALKILQGLRIAIGNSNAVLILAEVSLVSPWPVVLAQCCDSKPVTWS